MNEKELEGLEMRGDWVLALREDKFMQGIIHVPDSFKQRSPYSLCHKVGPKAHPAIRKGVVLIGFANSKESKDYFRVGSRKLYFANSSKFQAVAYDRNIFPLGDRVLVKRRRDIMPSELEGGCLSVPQQWGQEQSLDVEIVKFGLPADGSAARTTNLKLGDVCRLQSWQHDMFELSIAGEYHLIVNLKDILFKV